jgi:hypothetical protein
MFDVDKEVEVDGFRYASKRHEDGSATILQLSGGHLLRSVTVPAEAVRELLGPLLGGKGRGRSTKQAAPAQTTPPAEHPTPPATDE